METLVGWSVAAVLVVACGCKADPCDALGGVRQQLYDIEHENVGAEVRAKASSVEQKDEAVTAVFSELVATCTASHWSKDVVDCFVASVKAGVSDARQPACMKDPAAKSAFDAFGAAEDRVFTRLFGPSTAVDDLIKAGEAAGERAVQWEKRRKSSVEPRVQIPARYTGLAWFSRQSGPALQFFSDQLPACAKRILLDVDGYYQTQGFGGEPSLIAVFGLLDRDPAEACFQEAIARIVPGARLERDGALTRLVTTRTAGYFGWASDGTVYWNPDRATVADAVAQKTTIASNADVMALVGRIDRTKHAWFVIAGDVTSKFIGVPSTGFLFATDLFEGHRKYTAETLPRLSITIEFASAADAKRAAAAVRAPHPSLSRPLVSQLAKLAPVVRDRDVEFDIAAVFSRPELLDEMRAVVERIKKQ